SGRQLLARSDTFSERTRIWHSVAVRANEHLWFGHGYGAFWTGPAGAKAIAELRLRINHGHNGALDLYAELGIVGLLVVLLPVAWATLAAVRHALRAAGPACVWPATSVVFFVASNLGES